jgi:nuclear GTP-binding protein
LLEHSSKRMTTKLRQNIKKRVADHDRKMRKEARKMKAMGVFRGPKKEKTMHVPNLYPFKKKLIESIENKKRTNERAEMLDKLSLKSKATTNISVIKEDPQERENRFMAEKEFQEDSKYCKLLFLKSKILKFKKPRVQRNTT